MHDRQQSLGVKVKYTGDPRMCGRAGEEWIFQAFQAALCLQ